jgi:hypothetical protein
MPHCKVKSKRWIKIKGNQPLHDALQDFATIIKVLGKRPTHCRELVVMEPGYMGFCDASTLGTGGVWFAGAKSLNPVVWHVEWPDNIRNNVVSFDKPHGTITNSDLEMVGMVLHYLVLEHLVDLQHVRSTRCRMVRQYANGQLDKQTQFLQIYHSGTTDQSPGNVHPCQPSIPTCLCLDSGHPQLNGRCGLTHVQLTHHEKLHIQHQ